MQETQNPQTTEEHNSAVDNHNADAPNPKRPIKSYIIAIAILIVALIIISLMPENADDANQPATDDNGNEITVTIDDGENETEVKIDLTDFTEGFSLDNFDDLDQAGLIINSSQGRPTDGEGSEILVSQVVSGSEENMVYFSTMSLNQEQNENFVGVYHYNTVTNRWQRVYKETMEVTEEATPLLRVLARTGNHLVLLKELSSSNTGSCNNFYLAGDMEGQELLIMNLDDPYAGFASFPLPEQMRQTAETEQAECLASIE
jgi:hypothetical protein